MKDIHQLMNTLPQQGKLEWIGLRPARRAALDIVEQAECIADHGIRGDRSAEKAGGKRQVTLIQAEHLPVIASCVGEDTVTPEMLRRNLMVSGINLLALKDKIFTIGSVTLEYTGTCPPCSFMEETLGNGGYNAMRGHGGITAKILTGGVISIGDTVSVAERHDESA